MCDYLRDMREGDIAGIVNGSGRKCVSCLHILLVLICTADGMYSLRNQKDILRLNVSEHRVVIANAKDEREVSPKVEIYERRRLRSDGDLVVCDVSVHVRY